jgi:hypothetical protein
MRPAARAHRTGLRAAMTRDTPQIKKEPHLWRFAPAGRQSPFPNVANLF